MKRLIRKADEQNTGIPPVDLEMVTRLRNEVQEDLNNVNTTNMILVNQLDEADIRHDKCPQCKQQPMKRKEGFKICPSCGSIYKMLDGSGYMVIG